MYFATLSGLAIAGLVVLGTCLLAGGSTIAYGSYKNKKDAIAAAKRDWPKFVDNIYALKQARIDFVSYRSKLEKGYEHLMNARMTFTNGGHVLDGVPLGAEDFTILCTYISSAISSIDRFIDEIDHDISKNLSAIEECKKVIYS